LLDPERPERLARLCEYYRGKRDAFERALQLHMGDLADWSTPAGGLFFWLRLKRPRDLIALLPRAIEQGVAFVPGDAFFCAERPPQGYLRLNFSHTPAERVDAGLSRLSNLLREH
jgi:DNA-binding transcriptional MocR family regulator